jgi:hypothetical protein
MRLGDGLSTTAAHVRPEKAGVECATASPTQTMLESELRGMGLGPARIAKHLGIRPDGTIPSNSGGTRRNWPGSSPRWCMMRRVGWGERWPARWRGRSDVAKPRRE